MEVIPRRMLNVKSHKSGYFVKPTKLDQYILYMRWLFDTFVAAFYAKIKDIVRDVTY